MEELTKQFEQVVDGLREYKKDLVRYAQNIDERKEELEQRLIEVEEREKKVAKQEKSLLGVKELAAKRLAAKKILEEALDEANQKCRTALRDRDVALNKLEQAKRDPLAVFK